MKRPITIASGQFGDLSLEELCRLVSSIGYEGIEVACQAHINVHKVLEDDAYVAQFRATLEKYGLNVWALGAHLIGQCVGDNWDPRLDNFAPNALAGRPDEIRAWAVEEMKTVARAAQKLGVKVVTCFLGSPIWAYWYSFPQTPPSMVDEGFARIKELWTPISTCMTSAASGWRWRCTPPRSLLTITAPKGCWTRWTGAPRWA